MGLFKVTPKFIIENCKLQEGQYPCAKRSVYCCIRICKSTGERDLFFFGTNWGPVDVGVCPRSPGEDYDKCHSICQQTAHAEVNAIAAAGDVDLTGAIAYLTGHIRICDDCLQRLKKAGIKKAYMLDTKKEYSFG